MLSALPGVEVPVDLMGRACVGVAPTGSLFIDMSSVCDVRKSRKVGHVSHVCGGDGLSFVIEIRDGQVR